MPSHSIGLLLEMWQTTLHRHCTDLEQTSLKHKSSDLLPLTLAFMTSHKRIQTKIARTYSSSTSNYGKISSMSWMQLPCEQFSTTSSTPIIHNRCLLVLNETPTQKQLCFRSNIISGNRTPNFIEHWFIGNPFDTAQLSWICWWPAHDLKVAFRNYVVYHYDYY